MIIRGKKHDVLASPEALAAWWKQAGEHDAESHAVVEEEPMVWTTELLAHVKHSERPCGIWQALWSRNKRLTKQRLSH